MTTATEASKPDSRLKGKDLINIGIYTAIYGLAMIVVGFLGFIPIFIPLLAVLVPLLGGIPFMLYLTKVKKPGMIAIMGLLLGVLMLATGMGPFTIVTGVVAGLAAEFTWRWGNYQDVNKAVLTWGVFSMWVIGNFLPFYIGRDAYFATLKEGFGADYTTTLAGYMPNWMLWALIAASFVCGILGGMIGKALTAKHFVRAGVA